jgi:hypothetical protein
MPYPESFLRHTLLWTLPGGEVASTTCAWRNGSGIVSTPDAEATALAGRALALWDSIKGEYPIETNFVGSRVAWIGVDGLTVETVDRSIAPSNGFDNVPSLPTEVALVASLRTTTYGRTGRGRMYLPALSRSKVKAGGRVLDASQSTIADAMAAYLADLTVGASTLSSCVASRTLMALRNVTQVQVGDVFDSQRRRRDALTEVIQSRAV